MTALTAAPALLERAVGYALSTAGLATPQLLPLATPCGGWDLRTLLHHVCDSLDALSEAMGAGYVGRGPAPGDEPWADADPVATLSRRAAGLLRACAAARPEERLVAIGDRELTVSMVAAAGAIEIAVHGWDISVACGSGEPVPDRLAAELLPLAAVLITPATRAGLFDDPVPVPGLACPGDRLVAFLGRRPCPPAVPGTA
jgi:uncharacterized protein (TIGR03086 family)